MTILILIALAAGILCGRFLFSAQVAALIGQASDWVLMLLMFSVGISVGTNKDLFKRLRRMDLRVWMVPAGVILGSMAGGALCSLFVSLGFWESVGVSAGMGWYSLCGVMLSDFYGADVGAAAFLSNPLLSDDPSGGALAEPLCGHFPGRGHQRGHHPAGAHSPHFGGNGGLFGY